MYVLRLFSPPYMCLFMPMVFRGVCVPVSYRRDHRFVVVDVVAVVCFSAHKARNPISRPPSTV